MVSVRVFRGKFLHYFSFQYFGDFFDKTVIKNALAEYEMIIANEREIINYLNIH